MTSAKLKLSLEMEDSEICQNLTEFTSQYVSPLNVVNWESSEQKKTLKLLLDLLKDDSKVDCHLLVLQSIKVFARNKLLLESVVTEDLLDELLRHSAISTDTTVRKDLNEDKINRIKEAQRCLSNIYLQCHRAQDMALNNATLPGVMQQTTMYREYKIPAAIISFDIKILFLITAQRTESRTVVIIEHRALSRLTSTLENIMESAKAPSKLSEEESVCICDILKALFNLTCGFDEKQCDEEESSLMIRLSKTLQSLILLQMDNVEKKTNIVWNAVNLLSNYQGSWTAPLIEAFNKDFAADDEEDIEYDGKIMNAIHVLVNFLDHQLTKMDGNKAHLSLKENLAPILKLLTILSLSHRHVRKYLRQEILPPLRDVSQRPEVGNAIKNKLCRLLTTPDTTIGSMVAEFLFTLCKEKVSRFVKHTGYGNAAGLLARRGLMLGHRVESKYSSSDTDSDTEEYVANAHKINPVTGHVEPPKKSPFEGMTEEQKEYEANQLANLIHQLHELGAIKPGKIGPDGKPVAVEHVLELTEGVADQQQSSDED